MAEAPRSNRNAVDMQQRNSLLFTCLIRVRGDREVHEGQARLQCMR